jgi:hypothetical protein
MTKQSQSKQIKSVICPSCRGKNSLNCRDCAGQGSILPWRYAEIIAEQERVAQENKEWAENHQRELAARKARIAVLLTGMMAIGGRREK